MRFKSPGEDVQTTFLTSIRNKQNEKKNLTDIYIKHIFLKVIKYTLAVCCNCKKYCTGITVENQV